VKLRFAASIGRLWFLSFLAAACAVPAGNSSDGAEPSADTAQVFGQTRLSLGNGDGISTCGPAHNERCDAKLAVKVSDEKTVLLSKYDITAGRFRSFVAATGGDLRSYTDAHRPAWWNGPWAAALAAPNKGGVGNLWADSEGYGYDWSVWLPWSAEETSNALGPYSWGIRAGDMALAGPGGYTGKYDGEKSAIDWELYGPGNSGCTVGSYGARTYWQPNGTFDGDDNGYPQSVLDKKALNCVSYHMLQAFCAWDGGRLPSGAELNASWGAEAYPWGETVPYYADFSGNEVTAGPKDLANYGNVMGTVYASPDTVGVDMSNRLSIPGDFPKGNGPYGHSDIVGNVIKMTGDTSTGTASQTSWNTGETITVTNAPLVKWHKGGSFQGHQVGASYTFISTNRYLAMGGRCAYDTGAPAASAFPMGFKAEYFAGTELAPASRKGGRVDPYIAFTTQTFANPAASAASTPYSVRWTAKLSPRYSQTYTFKTIAGDGVRVWVNGVLLINDWTSHAAQTKSGTIALSAGKTYAVKVEHYNAGNAGSGAVAKLLWSSSSQLEQVIPPSRLTPQ
jgi:hypothetical protein